MGLVIGLLVVIGVLVIMLLRMALNPPSKGNKRLASRRKRLSLSALWSGQELVDSGETERQEPQLSQPATKEIGASQSKRVMAADHDAACDTADAVLGLTPSDAVVIEEQLTPRNSASSLPSVEAPVVTLMLFAPEDRPYGGYELLQALLSNGLRYGSQQIFHYYQSQQPDSGVLFSCASAVNPGTFDLPNMGGFSTPGLILFFDAQAVKEPKQAFEQLLQTIDSMVDDLGGQVCDAQQRLFTKQSLLSVHHQLDQYVQSCRTPDLFATAEH